ncbi:hypothetical protein [Roseateles chitosanitabidus]|uniref:hypothetical protein n=1 Tax=Roseateles chitosanitabidus TaxID=65048 RepID=UPI00082BB0A9|nr:hypothetical protein [Roseateles chitosanitabidus]MBO9687542.1 hypothetical protein [Roseateles chitosanitabidus]
MRVFVAIPVLLSTTIQGTCGRQIARPFLTTSVDHRTRLVLRWADEGLSRSRCECMRTLLIKLSN